MFEKVGRDRRVIARDDRLTHRHNIVGVHPCAQFKNVFVEVGLLERAGKADGSEGLCWVLDELHTFIIWDREGCERIFGWDHKGNRVCSLARNSHRRGHGDLLGTRLGCDRCGHGDLLAAGIAAEDIVTERAEADAGRLACIVRLNRDL